MARSSAMRCWLSMVPSSLSLVEKLSWHTGFVREVDEGLELRNHAKQWKEHHLDVYHVSATQQRTCG